MLLKSGVLMIFLAQIWQIADRENRGLLTPAGFGIVLRLIGYAQAGQLVSADLALQRECMKKNAYGRLG